MATPSKAPASPNVLELRGVSKSFVNPDVKLFHAIKDVNLTIKDEPDGTDLDRERPLVAILSIGAHRCDARNTPRGGRNVHEPRPHFVFGRCDHRGVRELHSLDVNPAAWSVPSTR